MGEAVSQPVGLKSGSLRPGSAWTRAARPAFGSRSGYFGCGTMRM